jgi:hypothetical protein
MKFLHMKPACGLDLAGALLSQAIPVLVLPDSQAAAAAELARLPAGVQSSATVLRLVASVLRYLQQREDAAGEADSAALELQYPPLAVARLAAAARKLLDIAERARWPALTALLLPVAVADGWQPQAAMQQGPASAAAAELAVEAELASGSGKAGTSHAALDISKPASGGSSKMAAPQAPAPAAFALAPVDRLRRVMHPAVLAGTTVLVAGTLVGVGIALVSGYLP